MEQGLEFYKHDMNRAPAKASAIQTGRNTHGSLPAIHTDG